MVVTSLREIIRVAKGWTGVNAQKVQNEENDDDDDYVQYIANKTNDRSSANKIAKINKMKHSAKSTNIVNNADANSDDSASDDSGEDAAAVARKAAYASQMRRQSSFTASAVSNATRGTILKDQPAPKTVTVGNPRESHIEMEPDPLGASNRLSMNQLTPSLLGTGPGLTAMP